MVTTPGVYKFDNTDYEISAKIVIKKNFIFYFSLYFNFKQIRDQDFNWISKLADNSFGSEVPTSFCRSLHYNYNQTSCAKISYLLIAFWLANTECMLYQGTAASYGVTVSRHRTIWIITDHFLECICRFPFLLTPSLAWPVKRKWKLVLRPRITFPQRLWCTSRFLSAFQHINIHEKITQF